MIQRCQGHTVKYEVSIFRKPFDGKPPTDDEIRASLVQQISDQPQGGILVAPAGATDSQVDAAMAAIRGAKRESKSRHP